MTIICPTCRTVIDPSDRCTAERGLGRCMEKQGHEGWHWSDVGHGDGSVQRWTGEYSVRSCAERLDLRRWCEKLPGHPKTHRWHDVTFWDEEDSAPKETQL